MQLTKGAIGNLINRYKAVLKKCHLLNVFGSLAVAGMLVMGGAAAAGAAQWQDMPDNPTITIDQPNQQNNYADVEKGQTVVVNGANTATGAETSMAITGQEGKPGVNRGEIWVVSGEGGTGNGYAEGMGGVYNSQFSIVNEGSIFVDGDSASKAKAMSVNPNGSAENKGLIVIKNGGGIVDNSGSASKTMINSGTIAVEGEGGIGIFYRKEAITDGEVANRGTITVSNGGIGVQISNDTFNSSYNNKVFINSGTIIADADSVAIHTHYTDNATIRLEGASHVDGLIKLKGTNNKLVIDGVGANGQESLHVEGTLSGSISNGSNIAFTEDSQLGIDGAYSIDNTSTATLNNVTFIAGDNDASKALVVIDSDSVTLNGGLNTGAEADNTIDSMATTNGNATINGAVFKNNTFTADRNYPIIGAVAANLGDQQSLTITGSTFEGNTVKLTGTGSSGSAGGAAVSVVGKGEGSTLTIADSTFTGNHYQDTSSAANGAYGGAIGVQNASVTLSNVEMTKNSTDSGQQVQGGAYYQSKGSLTADHITVSENTVTTKSNVLGGGMSLFGVGGSISNSAFAGNIVSAEGTALGGGLYMRGSRWGGESDLQFSISNTSFTGNELTSTADGAYGGGLYVKGDASNGTADGNGKISLELAGVTFDGNKVNGATESQGGALYILGADDPANATVSVSNSIFSNNKAEGTNGWGGAIYNAGTLSVDSTRFENNTASAQGGAIYVHPKAELDVTNSYFKGNSGTAGGAVAIFGDNSVTPEHSISNTVFEGNTATREGEKAGKGGAIAILEMDTPNPEYTTALDLSNVTFLNNTSNGTGGAIHSESGTLTITDAVFSGNSAEQKGGAIYNDANSSITFKGDNLFTGNTAAEGKDIYNEGDITFDGTNTQMDGGMVMAKGTVAVNNSQVSMAELDARAGNITVTSSELSVSKLTGNTLGSSLTVGTDGIVNIGNLDTTKLGEAMNDAGMGSGSAVLALNTSVTLDNNARIVVGKDASQNTATAVFGENSLLVVDAEGVTGNQVIHADGDDSKTAFIHSGAQLRIINAVAGEYVTVLNGFDTIMNEHDELEAGWVNNQGVENLDYMLSSYATIVEGPDGQPDVVVVSELNDPTEALPGIDPDLAPVLNEVWANKLNDVDSPDMGVRFLSRAARADYVNGDAAKSAATIESAARIAFAGAVPQMTKMASDAATNAVVNRLGFADPADGAQAMNAEGQIVDRNTTGFALWIAPLWQSQHGWGMEAGNLDYGFNGNLGGVSLGADYTFENAIRAGITFNIGGGYAETSGGDLNSTQNNMNFWGLGAYAGWNYENFAVMADVSYTSTWNQLEQDLDPGMGMGDLEADVQATAISAGLRAEYKLETSVLDVIPHVGVRYMSLNTWGYDVDARDGTVMEGDGFHQDIWTFPVGVTFSKDFTLDSGWSVKPSLDFSVIPAAGDIKAKEDVRFTGAPAVAEMETQMMDYLTWQGGVGLEMGNDTMSFGVNYTLQAGQHTTGHGVFGSFRYEF
ncbi:autotransporter domain-containing protein [Desulfovibrio piger]|uniref:autotransporter domain-containing protein n=1 Tax=Desulfovibrio piger TaxID=901 RepID=UPI0026F18C87|nr:autotransporter domain-containing protein [Desulfovibrio piger]